MSIWNKVKDRLGKAASEVETHAVELRDTVNFEIRVRKLKSELEQVRDEANEVFEDVGRKVLGSMRNDEPILRDDFQDRMDYIDGLEKKMRDVEGRINDLYKQKNSSGSQEEVIVDPEDDKEGN